MSGTQMADSVDYAGRFAFLYAADAVWEPPPLRTLEETVPAVLSWLATQSRWHLYYDVLPQYRHLAAGFLFTRPLPFRWKQLAEEGSPEAVAARCALENWRSRYPVAAADAWFMDAGIHAIAYSVLVDVPLTWAYSPDVSLPGKFEPVLEVPQWRRHHESQAEFEARMLKAFQAQLTAYCKQVKHHLGMRKDNQDRDAEWTARMLAGESAARISKTIYCPQSKRSDPQARVEKAVRRFAARIVLTLPNGTSA